MPKDIFTKELKLFLDKTIKDEIFLEYDYYRNIKFLNEISRLDKLIWISLKKTRNNTIIRHNFIVLENQSTN